MLSRVIAVSALIALPWLALPACTGFVDPSPPSGDDDDDDNPSRPDADTSQPDDPDASVDPDDPDASVDPPDPDIDAAPDDSCGAWKVGTLTGYNNSDGSDDPNAGNVMEFGGLNENFYDHVPLAAIDMSDWGNDQYKYVDVKFQGTVGRVAVWDACRNEDCPDGTDCCTNNKRLFANPGYLIDVEVHTAERLWGVQNAENTLQDRIEYRICGDFDPDAVAHQYGAHRND